VDDAKIVIETVIGHYLDTLVSDVKDKISTYLTMQTENNIVTTAIRYHLTTKLTYDFHVYYLQTVSNLQHFLITNDYFRTFKQKYALQGIDTNYLERLENQKTTIIQLIQENKIAKLYFDYFSKVQLQYNGKLITKDLGSFFTKLVHTFRPDCYSPLDNPIKDYFGLRKESFFVSFLVISCACKEWTHDNQVLMLTVRQRCKQIDSMDKLKIDRLSDLKVLDLIFWFEANHG
jgi:hypothetical protein